MPSLEDVILKGNDAGKPGSVPQGSLYFATDTAKVYRFNGSAWDDVTPGGGGGGLQGILTPSTFYAPSLSSFTWVNQGGATATEDMSSIIMEAPANSGDSFRELVVPYPSAPFTLVAGFVFSWRSVNYILSGLLCRNSSSQLQSAFFFGNGSSTGIVAANRFNSPTSFNANLSGQGLGNIMFAGPMLWLKWQDDGTNRTLYWSSNGKYWIQMYQELNTAFVTPDQIGWFIDVNNSSNTAMSQLVSWNIT